jgi:hypothetical protein
VELVFLLTQTGSTFTVSSSLSTGISLIVEPVTLRQPGRNMAHGFYPPDTRTFSLSSYPNGHYSAILLTENDNLNLLIKKQNGATGAPELFGGLTTRLEKNECEVYITAGSLDVTANAYGPDRIARFYMLRLS